MKDKRFTNYWTGEPCQTANPNVPDGAEIIGEVSYCSGEQRVTYYCQRYEPAHPDYGHWALWKVGDWTTDKPHGANAAEWEEKGLIPAEPECMIGVPLTATKPEPPIQYHSKSDTQGRCSFTLHWLCDYFPGHPGGERQIAYRGQCFHADPREYGFPRPEEA